MSEYNHITNKEKEMSKTMNKLKINKTISMTLATLMLASTLSPLRVLANTGGDNTSEEVNNIIEEAEKNIEDKIPDENLKQAIREALGVTEITNKNILELQTLSIQGKGIEDLTGIDCATHLQSLSLYDNPIKEIEPQTFKGLRGLEGLYINKSQIQEIKPGVFDGLSNLIWLDIADNQINNLNPEIFKGLTRLRKIDVSMNQLQNLDPTIFNGLTDLKYIGLRDNQLKIIDPTLFKGLINLQEITLDNNQLQKLDPETFDGLINLQVLYLGNNQIKNIDPILIKDKINLKTLDLSNNQIQNLNPEMFQNLTNLNYLNLWSNQIQHLDPKTFDGLKNLQNLYLNNNQIKSIDPVLIKDKINLETLDLSGNQIQNLDPETFQNLINLKELNLNLNKIQHLDPVIFKNLKNLQYLVLSRNQIENLDPEIFNGLSKLQKLNILCNKLQNIDFIEGLNLSEEKILNKQYINLKMKERFLTLPNISRNPKFIIEPHDLDRFKIEGNKLILNDNYRGDFIKFDFKTDDIGKINGEDSSEHGFSGTIIVDTIEVKPTSENKPPLDVKFTPQIEKEVVEWGKKIDLTDNISNLPKAANIKDITTPAINTMESGNYIGKVRITFADNTTKEVEIPIEVKEKIETTQKQLSKQQQNYSQIDFIPGEITIIDNPKSDTDTQYYKKEAQNYWIFKIGDYNYRFVTPNKTTTHTADIQPFIKNERTYLPFRFVGYAINVEVSYNNDTRLATFKKNGNILNINIDTKKATLNEKPYELETDPLLINGRLVAPVSVIGKAFNKTVSNKTENRNTDIVWNNDTREVIIYNYK